MRAVPALQENCCQSQHTYAYVQVILADLGRQPGGGHFRRLAQELEAAAADQHRVALRMQP